MIMKAVLKRNQGCISPASPPCKITQGEFSRGCSSSESELYSLAQRLSSQPPGYK